MTRISAWRAAASTPVLATAFVAFHHFCLIPYRCNVALPQMQARTLTAADLATTDRGIILARQNLERLDSLPAACRNDLSWIMLVAGNCRIVGDGARAVEEYTRALARYERPELYYNRGMALLEMGQADRAIRDLAVAARFIPSIIDDLDPETHRRVTAAAGLR